MTVQEINNIILFGKLTEQELDCLLDSVKLAKVKKGYTTLGNAKIGDLVSFFRKGKLIIGTVTKINQSSIRVEKDSDWWTVKI